MIVAEIGINHFGDEKELNYIIDKLLASPINFVTIMCQQEKFYEKYKKKKINFELESSIYQKIIRKFKKKNKYIGLSVCDTNTYDKISHIDFDFYKLLSIAINDFNLINMIKKKNKKVFISTGFSATDKKIEKCINKFGNFKNKLELLHTPITYEYDKLNLNKILKLKNRFGLKTGYSHHFYDKTAIYASSCYRPDSLFFYCKQFIKKNRVYPDDKHALFLNEINEVKKNYEMSLMMHKKNIDIKNKMKIKKKIFNEIKK